MIIEEKELKNNLEEILKRVEKGEEVIVKNKFIIKPLKRKLGIFKKQEIPKDFNEENEEINNLFYKGEI